MEVVIVMAMRRETGIGARWDRHTHRYHENSTAVRRQGALGVERYGSGNPTTGTRGPALWHSGQE